MTDQPEREDAERQQGAALLEAIQRIQEREQERRRLLHEQLDAGLAADNDNREENGA